MAIKTYDDLFREGVREISRGLEHARWRPKYKAGMPVLDVWGDEAIVDKISTGIPNGYTVLILKSKHSPVGTLVFWPESNIKAHKRARAAV